VDTVAVWALHFLPAAGPVRVRKAITIMKLLGELTIRKKEAKFYPPWCIKKIWNCIMLQGL
jgi:hypothetical protein